MKKRGLKVGTYVKQGDKIGEVGMTGFTSGHMFATDFGKMVDKLIH